MVDFIDFDYHIRQWWRLPLERNPYRAPPCRNRTPVIKLFSLFVALAGYNVDKNLTPVLLAAMHTSFMSHLLVFVLALVLLQLVLTTTLLILT